MTGRIVELRNGMLYAVRGSGELAAIHCHASNLQCDEDCAAFRYETHSDNIDGDLTDVRYVHCAAMTLNGRAAVLGRMADD